MDWRHRAACRDEDPELFFPIGTSGPALLQVEQAKAVCRRCPVSEECLRWALETGQDAGVWGGMSEEERRAFTMLYSRRYALDGLKTFLERHGFSVEGVTPVEDSTKRTRVVHLLARRS